MKKKGFTLIELLIVVAIIGIIASIAIPNLLIAFQKSRQKATMSDMKSIGSSLEIYVTDWSFAPQAPGPITNLVHDWFVPYYIKVLPTVDYWGTVFQYLSGAGGNLDSYTIESYGRDKIDSGPDTIYDVVSLYNFNNDIMYSNGFFTVGPKVKN
ncbi:MAG TPA: prepilin-type N-terminal cleavage/methylation domain-containing protein [Acidobacteriota bacterium]